MGLLETAREALKEIPLSDVLKERLSLAFEQAADLQRKHDETSKQMARLELELDQERKAREKLAKELQTLRDEWAEEIRIHEKIEFRRGKRTRNRWLPFCPKCHLPVVTDGPEIFCSGHCGWKIPSHGKRLDAIMPLGH